MQLIDKQVELRSYFFDRHIDVVSRIQIWTSIYPNIDVYDINARYSPYIAVFV